MSNAPSIELMTFDGPGPTYFLTIVVSVQDLLFSDDSPVTVNVLPVSVVILAKDPGKSFPFVIATLISFNETVEVVPSRF